MHPHKGPLASAVLCAIAIVASACGGDDEHDCSDSTETTLSVRADATCPSAQEASGEVKSTPFSFESLADASVRMPARTVCWYRLVATKRPIACVHSTRDAFLADAIAPGLRSHAAGDDEEQLFACDTSGALYGRVVSAPVDDPRVASPAPAECPAEPQITPMSRLYVQGVEISGFVGRDLYPARLACRYAVTRRWSCGGGSGGCLKGAWPSPS